MIYLFLYKNLIFFLRWPKFLTFQFSLNLYSRVLLTYLSSIVLKFDRLKTHYRIVVNTPEKGITSEFIHLL